MSYYLSCNMIRQNNVWCGKYYGAIAKPASTPCPALTVVVMHAQWQRSEIPHVRHWCLEACPAVLSLCQQSCLLWPEIKRSRWGLQEKWLTLLLGLMSKMFQPR